MLDASFLQLNADYGFAFSLAAPPALKPFATLAMAASQFGVAVPNFWFALLLVYVFAVWLRLVPAGGADEEE